jgi:xylulokinase
MRPYLMGIDVGTTGANAMVFDTEGNTVGGGYREYVAEYPQEHYVEQDAEVLVESVFEVCRNALAEAGVDPREVIALGMSSQRATFGLLDADDRLIGGRFYVWQDNRAYSEIPEIASRITPEELYRITGMPLTPTYTLEKLCWIKRHQPERYAQTHKVVFPGDYMLWRLGAAERVTEVTNACCSGMIDVRTLSWSEQVLNALDIDMTKLMPLVNPGTVVGRLSAAAAAVCGLREGTLLVCGTGDQQSAAIGAGVIEAGRASLTLGTAGLLVVATERLEFERSPGLMAASSGKIGLYELEGIQLGAASCFRWLRDLMFHPDLELEPSGLTRQKSGLYKRMDGLMDKSPPGANGLVFLPYLSGAGYPYWDPSASGLFAGLRFSHMPGDLIRAVMEGVTLESFDMYQKMKAAGVAINSLTVTGGAMECPGWRQAIADIFGVPITPLKVPNATLVGAAIFAGVGAGVFRDVTEGVERMVRFEEPVLPVCANAEVYRRRYETYTHMSNAVRAKNKGEQ